MEEDSVSKEEFDNAKTELLNFLLVNPDMTLKDRLSILKSVSHVLGENKTKEVRKELLSSKIKSVISGAATQVTSVTSSESRAESSVAGASKRKSDAGSSEEVEEVATPPKKVSIKLKFFIELFVKYFLESFIFTVSRRLWLQVPLIPVCEIPRIFERVSPSNFRKQGSFIRIKQKNNF